MHTPTPASCYFQVREKEFRQRAERAGMRTDGEIAKRMGVHRITVWRVLTGQNPPGESFIANALARLPGFHFDDVFEVRDPLARSNGTAA